MAKEIKPTKVFEEEFKGNKLFVIREVEAVDGGEKLSEYPVVSFGLKKANAILRHVEDLRSWVNEQNNSGS